MSALWILGGALLVTAGCLEGWPRVKQWWQGRQAERGARDYLRRRGDALKKAQQEKSDESRDVHRW